MHSSHVLQYSAVRKNLYRLNKRCFQPDHLKSRGSFPEWAFSGGCRGGEDSRRSWNPPLTYLHVCKVWEYFAHVYVRYGHGTPLLQIFDPPLAFIFARTLCVVKSVGLLRWTFETTSLTVKSQCIRKQTSTITEILRVIQYTI